jgi:hypothetical protein
MTHDAGRQRRQPERAGSTIALAVWVLAVASACGARGQEAESTGVSLRSEAVTTAPTVPEPAEAPQSPTSQPVVEIAGVGTAAGPAGYEPAELEPPVGAPPTPMLAFDAAGAYRLDGNGFSRIIDGPISELVDDGTGGIVFQRGQRDRVIWWLPAGATAPQELLVTEEVSYLILEGVTGSGDDREVLYQRVLEGTTDVAQTTLRTYHFQTGEVTELAVTGGADHGTQISPVVGGRAAGTWTVGGASGYFLFDLASGQAILDPATGQPGGAQTIGQYQQVAVNGEELIGVGPPPAEAGAVIDRMVVYRVDGATVAAVTVAELPWADGAWYPTSLYVHDQTAVMSRAATADEPAAAARGPIAVDLVSGQSTTLPFAADVRPVRS